MVYCFENKKKLKGAYKECMYKYIKKKQFFFIRCVCVCIREREKKIHIKKKEKHYADD